MKIANIRPPYSVGYGLVIAVSLLTLSGCVSAVTDDQETAAAVTEQDVPANETAQGVIPPKPASGTAANTAAGYVDPSMVSSAAPVGAQQEQLAASSPPVYGSAPAIAGLVTQPTAISAGNSSIYSNGSQPVAVQSQMAEGEGVSPSIPAYVPVPGINPALNSVYSAPPQVLQQPQPQNTVLPQEQSAVLPTTASQPPVANPQTKNDTGDSSGKQAVSLAAFFAGAAKKRAIKPTTNVAIPTQEVASLPQSTAADDLQAGIALNGRATMSDEFDDAHVDEEDEPVGLMKLASLSGLSRIAPNGLFLQTDHVNVGCFKPELVNLIKDIEGYYHRPAIITSGYRPPKNVRQGSKHYTCEAADIQIEGVSKWELANYLRSRPNRGGVGTYCHTESVHVDTGEARDWNWRCRRTTAKKS